MRIGKGKNADRIIYQGDVPFDEYEERKRQEFTQFLQKKKLRLPEQ